MSTATEWTPLVCKRKHPIPSVLIVTSKQKNQGICVFLDILRKHFYVLICKEMHLSFEIYTSFDMALDISLLLYKWHKSVLYFQELTYILLINFIKWNVYSYMLLLSLVTLHVIYMHAHMHMWKTAKKLRFYFTWNLTCHSWGEYKQKTQHHWVRDKENCWKHKKNY